MRRMTSLVLASFLCLFPATAPFADTLDFGQAACAMTAEALKKGSEPQRLVLISWLMGYAAGAKGNKILDIGGIDKGVGT